MIRYEDPPWSELNTGMMLHRPQNGAGVFLRFGLIVVRGMSSLMELEEMNDIITSAPGRSYSGK